MQSIKKVNEAIERVDNLFIEVLIVLAPFVQNSTTTRASITDFFEKNLSMALLPKLKVMLYSKARMGRCPIESVIELTVTKDQEY